MRMSDQGTRQVKIQLAMMLTFVLMFVPFLIFIVIALFSPQPSGNRVFGAFGLCFVAVLALLSIKYLFFFAVHLRSAKLLDSEVLIERLLAPDVRVSNLSAIRATDRVVPSLVAPGYQRGVFYRAGVSSFFVPDNLPDARLLRDRLTLVAADALKAARR